MKRTVRIAIPFFLFLIFALVQAGTITREARVLSVDADGWLLKIGGDTVPVAEAEATRYWRKHAPAERGDFKAGEAVVARFRNDVSPPLLREMADVPTWKWLQRIRTEALPCTLIRAEADEVVVRFNDGTLFTYRPTLKTRSIVQGQPINVVELDPGKTYYARGRLQANMETWLISISDDPKLKTHREELAEREKPLRLAAVGSLRAPVERHLPSHRIFDIRYEDRLLHITYTSRTVFWAEGKKTLPSQMRIGQDVRVAYKRDGFGRLVATKVELFQAG